MALKDLSRRASDAVDLPALKARFLRKLVHHSESQEEGIKMFASNFQCFESMVRREAEDAKRSDPPDEYRISRKVLLDTHVRDAAAAVQQGFATPPRLQVLRKPREGKGSGQGKGSGAKGGKSCLKGARAGELFVRAELLEPVSRALQDVGGAGVDGLPVSRLGNVTVVNTDAADDDGLDELLKLCLARACVTSGAYDIASSSNDQPQSLRWSEVAAFADLVAKDRVKLQEETAASVGNTSRNVQGGGQQTSEVSNHPIGADRGIVRRVKSWLTG